MDKLEYSEIYGTRVLVFLENAPQSNKYHQVLLNPEMYKAMTATICKPTGDKDGEIEMQEIKTSEEEYNLPDLPEAYSNIHPPQDTSKR